MAFIFWYTSVLHVQIHYYLLYIIVSCARRYLLSGITEQFLSGMSLCYWDLVLANDYLLQHLSRKVHNPGIGRGDHKTLLGPCSPSSKTSYRQISWSLEAEGLYVIITVLLCNLTSFSVALLPRCLSNWRAIRNSQPQPCGFETLRDIAVWRLTA